MAKSLLTSDFLSASFSPITLSNNFLLSGDLLSGGFTSGTTQTDILKLNTVQIVIDPLAAAAFVQLKNKITKDYLDAQNGGTGSGTGLPG